MAAGGAGCRRRGRWVANLPYNIATPLLVRWLREASQWERLTLMFQQEVAERICAAPGSGVWPAGGFGAVDLRRPPLLLRLPPGAFWPPPKVVSAVVGLVPHAVQPSAALFATMERLTAAAFSGSGARCCAGRCAGWAGRRCWSGRGSPPIRRAETLDIAEFGPAGAIAWRGVEGR